MQPKDQVEGTGAKDATKVIKIPKNNKEISVLTSKMQEVLPVLLAQERSKSKSTVSTRVASGSDSPVSTITTNVTLTRATRTAPIAAEGTSIPPSTDTKGRINGRPGGK